MSSRSGVFSARINYQNAGNAQSISRQPAMDRARGGKIHIKITLPEQRIPVTGGPGAVRIPKQICEFYIDLEELPLVNVAGYATDHVQTGPAKMSYPEGGDMDDGEENIYGGLFERG